MTNIGIKPTFNAHTSPLAETYIIGYDGDLYGQTVTVYFDKFVRPEKKFADAQELKKQIDRDTSYAHEYFKAHKIHSEVI